MSLNELIEKAKTTEDIIGMYEAFKKDFRRGALGNQASYQNAITLRKNLEGKQWVSVEALKPKLDALNELMKRQPLPEAFAWQNDFKSQYDHWTCKLKEVLGSDEKEPSQTRNVYPCGER